MEGIDGGKLVRPQPEWRARAVGGTELQVERRAVGVAAEVVDRVADPHHRLLQRAALGRIDGEASGLAGAEQSRQPLVGAHFGQHVRVIRGEEQATVAGGQETRATVAAELLAHEVEHERRDGVAGECGQAAGDVVAVEPHGGGVPQRQRREAIGVDVLGGLLELGETGQEVAPAFVRRPGHLEEDRAVALDDERTIGGTRGGR